MEETLVPWSVIMLRMSRTRGNGLNSKSESLNPKQYRNSNGSNYQTRVFSSNGLECCIWVIRICLGIRASSLEFSSRWFLPSYPPARFRLSPAHPESYQRAATTSEPGLRHANR